tara:strand:- start:24189 stop:24677 length:489 start_codon:yes stop_codon:yes gene_type:complete
MIEISKAKALQNYNLKLEKFLLVINDLMLDKDPRDIAHALEIPMQAVAKIQEDFGDEIGSYEQRTIQRLQRAIGLGTESLCEAIELRSIPPDKLAAALGVLIDKRELLAGKPTSRSQSVGDDMPDMKRLNALVLEAQEVEVQALDPAFQGLPITDLHKHKDT